MVNWVSSPLSFLLEHLHCCYIHFHCSYLYNYYNNYSREPCALSAEFQHFILRFNKISLLCRYHSWTRGESRGNRGVKERVTLQITLLKKGKFVMDITWKKKFVRYLGEKKEMLTWSQAFLLFWSSKHSWWWWVMLRFIERRPAVSGGVEDAS